MRACGLYVRYKGSVGSCTNRITSPTRCPPSGDVNLVLGQQAIVWIQTHGMRRRQRIRTRPLRAPPHLHLSLTLQRQGSDRDVRRRVLVISNTRALGIVNDRRRDRHRRTCAHEVHDPRQAPLRVPGAILWLRQRLLPPPSIARLFRKMRVLQRHDPRPGGKGREASTLPLMNSTVASASTAGQISTTRIISSTGIYCVDGVYYK